MNRSSEMISISENSTAAFAGLDLWNRLLACRRHSMEITGPLSVEDQAVQAAEFASPTKWHLAHTTWFFETFLLKPHLPDYEFFSDEFQFCFNSYYESIGKRQPRGARGLMTRPGLEDVLNYREYVDSALRKMFAEDQDLSTEVCALLELGIQHEQQHQELILTDVLALFDSQPLRPAYQKCVNQQATASDVPCRMLDIEGGLVETGYDGGGFCFDNEQPRHRVWLEPYRIANRLVTNHEWIAFINDGGYRNSHWWLSEGWAWVNQQGIEAPGYWQRCNGHWCQMTLHGFLPVDPDSPVCHLSHYEADAFAKWSGKRLPTEFEWEHAVATLTDVTERSSIGQNADVRAPLRLKPDAATPGLEGRLQQLFGQLWQWTSSAYLPYAGYRAPEGAVGEYNGKFMSSQMVLRGSSFATAPGHDRTTYRNFFYPGQRWQFTGMRLAEDLK